MSHEKRSFCSVFRVRFIVQHTHTQLIIELFIYFSIFSFCRPPSLRHTHKHHHHIISWERTNEKCKITSDTKSVTQVNCTSDFEQLEKMIFRRFVRRSIVSAGGAGTTSSGQWKTKFPIKIEIDENHAICSQSHTYTFRRSNANNTFSIHFIFFRTKKNSGQTIEENEWKGFLHKTWHSTNSMFCCRHCCSLLAGSLLLSLLLHTLDMETKFVSFIH